MANPSTTHVIEIEAGIGEPAFIPLSMGQELQPISVGKKGMWRIESPRVLDVHAFVYFDGTSLFLQSADDANAASVDGYRIGKAWTELHAPCIIEVGQARLRFRSLISDADGQATEIAASPPVQARGGPGSPLGNGSAPGASMPVAVAVPPPTRAVPPPAPPPDGVDHEDDTPAAFPKIERPFKPGEFSAPPDAESTRIAPLDAVAGRMASGSHPRPNGGSGAVAIAPYVNSGMMQVQGPMAAPVQALGFGTPQGFPSGPNLPPSPMYDSNPQSYSQPPPGPQSMPPSMPQGMMQGPGPQGYDPNQQQSSYPGQAYPNSPSGPYPAMGMNGPGMPPMNGNPGPGGYPAPAPTPAAPNGFVAQLKAVSPPKLISAVLFIIGAIIYLATDDPSDAPARKPVPRLDAGAGTVAVPIASGGTGPVPTTPPVAPPSGQIQPTWPAGVPCPPPNWPAGTPLPCTPSSPTTTEPPPRDVPPPPPPRGGRDRGEKDAGAPLAAGSKTLERQAADYVAAGDTAKAAAAYEDLMKREPNNKVYAEAARILRAKLDAGAP